MVMGLSDFEFITTYQEIPIAFDSKFAGIEDKSILTAEFSFDTANRKGKTISEYLDTEKSINEITELLVSLFGEALCQTSQEQKKKFSQAQKQQ